VRVLIVGFARGVAVVAFGIAVVAVVVARLFIGRRRRRGVGGVVAVIAALVPLGLAGGGGVADAGADGGAQDTAQDRTFGATAARGHLRPGHRADRGAQQAAGRAALGFVAGAWVVVGLIVAVAVTVAGVRIRAVRLGVGAGGQGHGAGQGQGDGGGGIARLGTDHCLILRQSGLVVARSPVCETRFT